MSETSRVLHPAFRSKIMSAEQAAALIQPGDKVGMSGFTGSGHPKAVPVELAKRISAAGYADQRPLDTNQTEAGKARNRRVAIVVLPLVSLTGSGVDNSDQTPAIPGAKPDPGLTTKAAAAAPRS